jgi:hypothetical protein
MKIRLRVFLGIVRHNAAWFKIRRFRVTPSGQYIGKDQDDGPDQDDGLDDA